MIKKKYNMLKMNRLFYFLVFVFSVGTSGCIKESFYINKRKDCPVLLQYSPEFKRQFFYTHIDGVCLVSDIPEIYKPGDTLWVDYTIHMKRQEYLDILSASDIKVHRKIHSDYIRGVVTGHFSDDFKTPIDGFFMKPVLIGSTLFFGFIHKAPAGQIFEYEMLYDPSERYTPAVYVKSRKANEVTGPVTEIKTMFGFDLTTFINQYRSDNMVRLYICYLSDVIDGKEEFKTYDVLTINLNES